MDEGGVILSEFLGSLVTKPSCLRQCLSCLPVILAKLRRHISRSILPRGREPGLFSLPARRQLQLVMIACCLDVLLTLGLPSFAGAEPAQRAESRLVSSAAGVGANAASVSEAAERFKIPEDWILKVIEVESGGNAHAISARGALGLMQIMPQT
ncbi:hypothetical protein ACVWYQ_003482 [Bradyrhizobium sp. USDA 3397]